jgi:hypothetical protein
MRASRSVRGAARTSWSGAVAPATSAQSPGSSAPRPIRADCASAAPAATRRPRREGAERRARRAHRREEPGRQAEPLDPVPGPVAGVQVEQQRPARLGRLAGELAAEPQRQPVGQAQEARAVAQRIRLARREPPEAGRSEAPGRPVAGPRMELGSVVRRELVPLGLGALVPAGPRVERAPAAVDDDDGAASRGRRDAEHVVGARAGAREGLAARRAESGPEVGQVDVRAEPAGARRGEGTPRPPRNRGLAGRRLDEQGANAAPPHVEPHQVATPHSSWTPPLDRAWIILDPEGRGASEPAGALWGPAPAARLGEVAGSRPVPKMPGQ